MLSRQLSFRNSLFSFCRSFSLSLSLSLSLSIYLSIYLSICLSFYLSLSLTLPDFPPSFLLSVKYLCCVFWSIFCINWCFFRKSSPVYNNLCSLSFFSDILLKGVAGPNRPPLELAPIYVITSNLRRGVAQPSMVLPGYYSVKVRTRRLEREKLLLKKKTAILR